MQKKYVTTAFVLGLLVVAGFLAKAFGHRHDPMSYFYYQAQENPSMDDIVVALPASNSSARGLFWGTSDEFCDAREGFLPGFCILELTELRWWGDSISFVLDSTESPFFSKPVDADVESSEQAGEEGYRMWRQAHEYFSARVMLKGRFSKDCLLLENRDFPHGKPYVFRRISREELLSRQRNSLSEEEENDNSAEGL